MQIPLEISYHNIDKPPQIDKKINERVAHLEKLADDIISCRIAVEQAHRRPRSGSPYRVRIRVTLPPNKEMVVVKEPNDPDIPLLSVVTSAFQALETQLKETVEQRRGAVKTHEEPQGLVVRLAKEQSFGMIRTPANEEIIFHANSVTENDFERLEIGTEVRFEAAMGDSGPYATTVQIVNKPGARESDEPPMEDAIPPGWRNQ